jgi:hypothetical protein
MVLCFDLCPSTGEWHLRSLHLLGLLISVVVRDVIGARMLRLHPPAASPPASM